MLDARAKLGGNGLRLPGKAVTTLRQREERSEMYASRLSMLPPSSPIKSQIAKFQIENSNKDYNQLIVNKNIGLKSTEWSGGWDGTF